MPKEGISTSPEKQLTGRAYADLGYLLMLF